MSQYTRDQLTLNPGSSAMSLIQSPFDIGLNEIRSTLADRLGEEAKFGWLLGQKRALESPAKSFSALHTGSTP
jgi:hypothetical protein